MADRIDSKEVLQAVRAVWPQLASLVGEQAWPEVKATIEPRLTEIEHDNSAVAISMDVIRYLSRFPAVRERLRSSLSAHQLRSVLHDVVAGNDEALAFFSMDESDRETLRHVVINPEGTGGGVSRKLANLRLDVRRLLDIFTDTASGAITALTGADLAKVGAVLAVIRAINKALTIEITEKDARVFYALMLAGAEKAAVSEAALLESANEHRSFLGLSQLSLEELRASLYTLEQLHSITRTPEMPGYWYIIESFRIRGEVRAI